METRDLDGLDGIGSSPIDPPTRGSTDSWSRLKCMTLRQALWNRHHKPAKRHKMPQGIAPLNAMPNLGSNIRNGASVSNRFPLPASRTRHLQGIASLEGGQIRAARPTIPI